MKTIFTFFAALLFTVQAFAGHEAGGGGALVCSTGNPIVTLDLYEAREVYKLEVDYGPESLDAMGHVRFVLDRFGKFDSGRAARYLRDAEEFIKIAVFKPGIILGDITDSMHVYIPDSCRVMQVVSQSQNSFPPRPRYIVVENLWNQLDETSKAAMILHEVVYKEGMENGHEHSLKSRYFHELIAANKVVEFGRTDFDYANFLRENVQFKHFYKHGIAFVDQYINDDPWGERRSLGFYPDGSLERAERPEQMQEILYGKNKLLISGKDHGFSPHKFQFHQSTGEVYLIRGVEVISPFFVGFKRFTAPTSNGQIVYGSMREIKSILTAANFPIEIQNIKGSTYAVWFDLDLNLVRIILGSNMTLKKTDGSTANYPIGSQIWINDKDLVVDH